MTKGSVLLCALALFVGACNNSISEAMEGEKRQLLPTNTTYNAEVSYSNNGKLSSRLTAKVIDRYQTKDTSYVILRKGFKAEFFDSLGHSTGVLQAQYGQWLERKRIMKGKKDVVFTNYKGEQLFTQSLTWYQDSALIYTPDPVKIVRPDGTIYGIGLRAAEDFSSYTINQITGELFVTETDTSLTANDTLP
ncbi:MAG TPA: LPS export ABC transporter periplasmic protein LptC [Luteibaculaceae bacterium]|nr:LPS export ABC transporter periplasmic protein LptC [Luteibaculaceae bacterium]